MQKLNAVNGNANANANANALRRLENQSALELSR